MCLIFPQMERGDYKLTIFPRLRQEAKKGEERTSWWSEGYHSARPLQGPWVQSLVGELRFCMPCGVMEKKEELLASGPIQ